MYSKSVAGPLGRAETFSAALKLKDGEKVKIHTIETWPFVGYFTSIGSTMSAVFLIGLLIHLTNGELIALSCAAGGIVGGLLFTILELRRLEKH